MKLSHRHPSSHRCTAAPHAVLTSHAECAARCALVRHTGDAACLIPMLMRPLAIARVWDWPLALTMAGWAMTIKCTLYLLVPANRRPRAGPKRGKNFARVPGGRNCYNALMRRADMAGMVRWDSFVPQVNSAEPVAYCLHCGLQRRNWHVV